MEKSILPWIWEKEPEILVRGTKKRRLTCSVANQGEGSFAQIWENRAKILPENSNLGLERGLGQSSADSYSAGRETGADSGCPRSQNGSVSPQSQIFCSVHSSSPLLLLEKGALRSCIPASPPPPSVVQKRPVGNWPWQGCWKLHGGGLALPPTLMCRKTNMKCTRGASRDGGLDKAPRGQSFWHPSKWVEEAFSPGPSPPPTPRPALSHGSYHSSHHPKLLEPLFFVVSGGKGNTSWSRIRPIGWLLQRHTFPWFHNLGCI